MAVVTVSRSGDRLIAVKQVPAEHVRDIEQEAEILQRLAHPGVVRLVDLVETHDGGRAMHTEFVSSDTWATRPITDPAGRAAGVAALAEVVADLHDMGFAHGLINPSHVLHGDGDRPVLCGFRLATEVTPENRRGDLVALADLCHDPAPDKGPLVEKLSALADAARAGRLDVRELARRLAMFPDKGSTAGEPGRTAAAVSGHGHRSRPGKKLRVVVAAVLGASVVVAAAGIWSRGQQEGAPVTITDGAGPTAAAADPTVTTGDLTVTTGDSTGASGDSTDAEAGPPADAPDPVSSGASTRADVAAHPGPARFAVTAPGPTAIPSPMVPGMASGAASDGFLLPPAPIGLEAAASGESVSLQPGAIIDHGGSRYGVGRDGDFVETGDWNCDGRPTPAIIRPSTGHIVLFDVWPAPGQTISMPVRWEVDAPTGAEAVAHGSCHLLRVYTSAGSSLFDPMDGR
ncbi:MAG: hypothetical protein OXH67_10030 [Acidimicrobiaceae bacterium]|nr:hypothetical protein [Acidimicrobiaceae bacterium]